MDTKRWEPLGSRPDPRRRGARAFRTALALAPLFLPLTLRAQNYDSVTGTVTSGNQGPLVHAWVNMVGTGVWALTTDDGSFRLDAVPPGIHTLEVRMLGYRPASLPINVELGKAQRVDVALTAMAVPIDPMTVTGDGTPFELRGFEERRARGLGTFFTREQIKRMQPRLVTDVLRRVPGMQIWSEPGAYGNNLSARSSRATGVSGSRPCPVLFYVDGTPFPVTGDIPINTYVSPAEIAAVEVYAGTSQIPVQFLSTALNARCGVIVIWTVSGRPSDRRAH